MVPQNLQSQVTPESNFDVDEFDGFTGNLVLFRIPTNAVRS